MVSVERYPGGPLQQLPDGYVPTREALHRLACYVLSPARKAVTGRIGLQPTPGGFGTPMFGAGEQLRIEEASLVRQRDGSTEHAVITSLAAAADFAGVPLSEDPGIGSDLPGQGDPDAPLPVSPAAVGAIGAWFGFSGSVLEEFRSELDSAGHPCSPAQLWPEHFDLGCNIEGVNFGASPGDGYSAEPYVYVGPWNTDGLPDGDFWNAPFGSVLAYKEILATGNHRATALDFLRRGAELALMRAAPQP
jgi:hypothetical protein